MRAKPWCKLWEAWWTSRSHLGIGGVALAIGPRVMSLMNARAAPVGTTWLVDASGRPFTAERLAEMLRFPVEAVAAGLTELVAVETFVRREDGVYGWPEFAVYQETPDAERMRQRRANSSANSSGTSGERFANASRTGSERSGGTPGTEADKARPAPSGAAEPSGVFSNGSRNGSGTVRTEERGQKIRGQTPDPDQSGAPKSAGPHPDRSETDPLAVHDLPLGGSAGGGGTPDVEQAKGSSPRLDAPDLDGLHSGDVAATKRKAAKKAPAVTAPDVLAVIDHYRTLHPTALKTPLATSKEVRAITARLAEGADVATLCAAIDGMHRTPHNLGQNERGTKYLDLELCMRDASRVTRFAEAATGPAPTPAPPPNSAAAREARGRAAGDAWLRSMKEREAPELRVLAAEEERR